MTAFTLAAWAPVFGQTYVHVQVDQPEALEVSFSDPEYSDSDTEVVLGEDLQITGGLNPYFLEWRTGSELVSTDSTFTAGLDENADYTLTVTDARGCYVTRTVTITAVTSVHHPLARLIRIYPIPASSYLQVDLPAELHLNRLTLISYTGKVTWQKQVTGNHRIPLDYPPGVYYLKIKNDFLETTYQIIIH